MSDAIENRLKELGITLPVAAVPVANYVPFTISGNLLHISGQLPLEDGKLAVTGILGRNVDAEAGNRAALLCAINILAQVKAALGGDLGRVKRVVKLNGFVASTHEFTAQPQVINGASDLFVSVLGEAGKHARSAVGVAALPLNAAVEIDAVVEIEA